MKHFTTCKVGDKVERVLGGEVPMTLSITAIDCDNGIIHCGDWKFDMQSGGEIDEELGWDGYNTGSQLTRILEE